MQVPRAKREDRLDALVQCALRNEPYPTPVQRAEAFEILRTRAARQAILPALEVASAKRPLTFAARLMALFGHMHRLQGVLLEENAYRRAQTADRGRAHAFARAPYVQFQPMW